MGGTRKWYLIYYSTLVRETDKAVLLELDATTEVWLPKDHVEFHEDGENVWLSQWIFEEKDLDVEVFEEEERDWG